MNNALLIVAASEQDANLYYTTRFWAPDPFIFTRINGKKILVMSDLEVDRARSESCVDEVLSMSKLQAAVKKQGLLVPGTKVPGTAEVLDFLFKDRGVKQVEVPATFPLDLADRLRSKGYTLNIRKDPFFPERMVKSKEEVEAIKEAIRLTEDAIQSAIAVIAQAEIKGEELWLRGRPLTSELIRKTLHLTLMGADMLGRETIVARGAQACDPHCIGNGTLRAHWPIVMDVFPVSMKSRYYADITRTVVKGKPSEKVKKMHRLVLEGQEIGFKMLKPGVSGKEVHQAILDHFEKNGFKTGEVDGRMQGFFHGTGHGLGLEIHEAPRVGGVNDILQAGQVVTVEPGLYYLDAGGIRIEDDVLIPPTGCEILSTSPRKLELG